MWDAAAEMGPSLKPSNFYLIRNARMVTNSYSGYLQAKLQQNKILLLKEKDADTNPHLKALMELASSFVFYLLILIDSKTEERGNRKKTILMSTTKPSTVLLKSSKRTNF